MSIGLNVEQHNYAHKVTLLKQRNCLVFILSQWWFVVYTVDHYYLELQQKKKKLRNLVTDGINFPTKGLVFRNSWKFVPAEISTIKLVLIPRF